MPIRHILSAFIAVMRFLTILDLQTAFITYGNDGEPSKMRPRERERILLISWSH
jgi:hypothetical protein